MKAKQLFENKKFFTNKHYLYIKDVCKGLGYVELTGGAIIDILNNEVPKDYDLLVPNFITTGEHLMEKGFTLTNVSKTAYTYKKEDKVIQLLKTKPEDFDFTINQCRISLSAEYIAKFDTPSYLSGILIPTDKTFNSRVRSAIVLKRVEKLKRKGFKMDDLCRKILRKNVVWYKRIFSNNNKSGDES